MRQRTAKARERRRVRAVAAFTLIEVLMSIFVLALGLLGLGALIPGIIREQRVASDRTLGIVVANDAKAYLNARADLRRLGLQPPPGTGLGPSAAPTYGLGVWLRDSEWSETYLWDMNSVEVGRYEDEGLVEIGDRELGVDPVRIPLADRLYPSPSSRLDAPQFVWDFVARRLPPSESEGFALLADSDLGLFTGTPDQWRAAVEVAVFVRRVDTGIRVPAGDTAYGLMLRSDVLPVGLESTGLPTGAGADTSQSQIYAPPMTLAADFDGTRRTVLTLSADDSLSGNEPGSSVAVAERLLMAAQVGQQLVDNLGNVYTVEEVIELDATRTRAEVRVRPAISGWIAPTGTGSWDWDDEESWTQIRQVVFVPQPPATAIVFRMGVEPNVVRSPSGSGAGRLPL